MDAIVTTSLRHGRLLPAALFATICLCASRSGHADITSNLEGHWRFEQTSGTYTDQQGNNSLTVSGATRTNRGYDGYGVTTGSSAYAYANTYANLNNIATNDAFTLAAWIYPTSNGTWQSIVSRASTGAGELWYFGFDGSGKLTIFGDGMGVTSYATLATGQWHHVAATYSKSQSRMKLYLNGREVTTATVNVDIASNTSNGFAVGANFNSGVASDFFQGRIDELRIYSRELLPWQVAQLCGGRLLGKPVFWINDSNGTAWNTVGRQADAMRWSAVSSVPRKTATFPLHTFVAVMKICTFVQARTRSKSIIASMASRRGLMLSGLVSYGLKRRVTRSFQSGLLQ